MIEHREGRPARGLTLVETLAATGLIALIVLFSLGLIPSFKVSNRRANTEMQAGAVAQSYLERARAAPFESVVDQVFPAQTIGQVSYRATQVVTDVRQAGGPPAVNISKRVRLTVEWTWGERDLTTFRETILVRIPRS